MVDRGGLENRCTAMYRGFESLFLRGDEATSKSLLFFKNDVLIGEMPEWSNGAVSKTVDRISGPRVRIPLSPQQRV